MKIERNRRETVCERESEGAREGDKWNEMAGMALNASFISHFWREQPPLSSLDDHRRVFYNRK